MDSWTASGRVYEKEFWRMGIENWGGKKNHSHYVIFSTIQIFLICIAFIMVKEQYKEDSDYYVGNTLEKVE